MSALGVYACDRAPKIGLPIEFASVAGALGFVRLAQDRLTAHVDTHGWAPTRRRPVAQLTRANAVDDSKGGRAKLRDLAGGVERAAATDTNGIADLWNSVTQKPDCSAISGFATLAAKFFFHESAR
jgi:hypothetical protein